jgi:Kef-type K+ transport system membrane component KefB/nucleotide-binding universal stress UspA family protein
MVVCLFLGTALSISSVKIVATVVRDMGFLRRDVGQVILASAIVDDTIGWIIIAMTLSLASRNAIDWGAVGKSAFGTIAFLAISFTFGRRIVFRLIQWANDFGRGEAPVAAIIIVIMTGMALITSAIGVHTVLGAFVAGILVGESPILTREIDEQLRGLTAGLFMPIFFGLSGLSADLTVLHDPHLALLTLLLIAIASIGKAAGAFAGASFGGLGLPQSLALAAGMNARGSTEIIVVSIGLSIGVISHDLFTMIVAMAFVTTVAMPPTLRWALGRLPIDEAEQKRLEREEIEARGVLSQWERILVVTDESASGKFAARIAGLLAGPRGMPVTVLKARGESADAPPAPEASAAEIVKAAATEPEKGEDEPARAVDVVERQHNVPWEDAIAAEAKKGYDLLVIGVTPTAGRTGGFDEHVSRLAQSFPGSLAIISARGRHEADPVDSGLKLLVPVTGSEVSRHGAELGLALAKAAGGQITALTVLPPSAGATRERLSNNRTLDAAEMAKEINRIADAMEQPVQIARRADLSAEDAILREARRGRHDVILLGVSRRPGERLSFGDVASALLEAADRSLVFMALEGLVRTGGRKTEEGGAA